jgi:hypothetical protein
MRNFRRLVLALVLVSLAGVSWGEENVWYCVEEASQGFRFDEDGRVEKSNFTEDKFTFKHIAESHQIAIAGGAFAGDGKTVKLACSACYPSTTESLIAAYSPVVHDTVFSLKDGKFVYAIMGYGRAIVTGAGTCTKF